MDRERWLRIILVYKDAVRKYEMDAMAIERQGQHNEVEHGEHETRSRPQPESSQANPSRDPASSITSEGPRFWPRLRPVMFQGEIICDA